MSKETLTLAGKVVLVTGGSRGIGRAIVKAFAAAGAHVTFTYTKHPGEAKALEAELTAQGYAATGVAADAQSPADAQGLIDVISREHGRLDVVVLNAGITRDNLLVGMEQSEWDEVISTNLSGAFHWMKPAAQVMMRRRQGVIITMSSLAATRPGRGHANYAASKGGLEALTKAMAVELAPRGIRVNCVAPGVVATDMSRDIRQLADEQLMFRIPLKRYGVPEDIAAAVLFLASEQASYITGVTLHVDGGMAL